MDKAQSAEKNSDQTLKIKIETPAKKEDRQQYLAAEDNCKGYLSSIENDGIRKMRCKSEG